MHHPDERPQDRRSRLFSLQAKLVLAMTALMVLSVVSTGAVFVLRSKNERQQQALAKVAATAPFFTRAFTIDPNFTPGTQIEYKAGSLAPDVDKLASARDVRMLIVGDKGTVLHDTSGGLQGVQLSVPAVQPEDIKRGYVTWQASAPGDKLTFVATTPVQLPGSNGPVLSVQGLLGSASWPFANQGPAPDVLFQGSTGAAAASSTPGVVLAVNSRKIQDAWLSALPALGFAGAFAMPFAFLAAALLARQIARPVHQLTVASEAMARGDFDQRVEVGRNDEVGRLASAFSAMAARVGQRESQMRALVANVSHDLKTPMTSILGYAQAVKEGVVATADVARVAGIIQTQAEQTSLLLNDLLFLSEVDAGQVLYAPSDVEAETLISDAVGRAQAAAEAKDVDIQTHIEPGLILHVDRDRTARALANVLDNAVKFSPAGQTVRLEVSARDSRCVVEVTNTGPRIDEEEITHIFERFHRGPTSGGHGLGLAITLETLTMDSGSLEARNTSDGVCFEIGLPLVR